jgi:glutamate synthase (NADH)
MGLVVEESNKQLYEIQEQPEEYLPYKPDKGYGWGEALPEKQGLYDPSLEKDACGVGFAANIKGKPSHKIVSDGKHIPQLSVHEPD